MTTIVLADDHRMVRQGLRAILEAEPGFDVVGEAGGGREALQLVESLEPEILVLDLMMPELGGLEVMRQIGQRPFGTRVIVLSMRSSEAYVQEALRNGARGYVLKMESAEELAEAVRAVVAGKIYLGVQLSQRAIEAYVEKASEMTLDLYDTLTTREREVLHLAAEGHDAKEIGVRLTMSPKTAMTHRANLMRKLGLHSQTELVHYALQRGITSIEV